MTGPDSAIMLLLLMMIHTFSVLSLQLKKLRCHNKSVIDLSNVSPARGHKEARRPTGLVPHLLLPPLYIYVCWLRCAGLEQEPHHRMVGFGLLSKRTDRFSHLAEITGIASFRHF